ncbi:MAG TPA: ROK family protein [Bacteroidales bacterium]|nr:ROK family protein [Bacteroidales bacterium]
MPTKHFFGLEKNTKSNQLKKDIIRYFLNNGKTSISELAKEMELSVPTVTKLINGMNEECLISDYGKVQTPEGRHPNVYGLNPTSAYFVGVDMTRHHLNMALMDFNGDMVKTEFGLLHSHENTPESLDRLCNHINNFINSISSEIRKNIINISLNIAGRVNPESGYSYSSFYFSEEPISSILSKKLKHNVVIDNDTRAMTYGEYMKGVVEGQKDVIFINASWGLGIGIIIDGKIHYGKSGFSGEFGHFPAFDNEIICHCGKKGCLETEASGQAIYRTVINRIQNGESSIITDSIKDLKDLTLSDIINATNQEDTLCIEIVEEVGATLGRYIAGLINIFNPELVVIGGRIAETGSYLMLPIRSAVRKYSLNLVNKDTQIELSKLKNKAGVYGACLLGRNRLFDQ